MCELLAASRAGAAASSAQETPALLALHTPQVAVHTINPLALSVDELYGSFEAATHEWRDGVLARIMRTVCRWVA